MISGVLLFRRTIRKTVCNCSLEDCSIAMKGRITKICLWAEKAPFVYGNRYSYEGLNTKEEAAGYGKLTWQFAPKWSLFADVQFRHVGYKANKYKIDESLNSFNPKAGLTFLFE